MNIVIKAATKEGVYATMHRRDSISNRAELLEIALETMGTCTIIRHTSKGNLGVIHEGTCTIIRHTSKGNLGVIHEWEVIATSVEEAEHFINVFEEVCH